MDDYAAYLTSALVAIGDFKKADEDQNAAIGAEEPARSEAVSETI